MLVTLSALVLAQTTFKGPSVVVLLQNGCPCAKECHESLNLLAAVCRGKIKFEGVVDGDAKAARELAQVAFLRFPIQPDPHKALIHALSGKEALDLRLVGADGRVLARWNGLCRAHIASLVDAVCAMKQAWISRSTYPLSLSPRSSAANTDFHHGVLGKMSIIAVFRYANLASYNLSYRSFKSSYDGAVRLAFR